MNEITAWRKREMERMRRDMDLLFRRFRHSFGVPRSLWESAEAFGVSVSEGENTVTVKADLPGVNPDDIEIRVSDDTLTLKGEAKEQKVEKGENFRHIAKRSSTFSQSIALPCRITPEDVKVSFKDGQLEIILPKCKPREIRSIRIETK